ncbi:MFS transporter [Streptomyces sp. MST-110588]|uniref:MFS transporter n=1 Tax=Streptomyces sp. MST-110588 TaxID=2833628 RepID=UPI001F5CFA59|nr:MFS transporter [Streptomyces sp. MST-110588]UNO41789.1 MFS transporter [Streptomyces sp. MST-110588]
MTAVDPGDALAETAAAQIPEPPPANARGGGVLSPAYRALTCGIISVISLIAFEASAVNTAMPVAAHALDGVGLYAFAFSGFFTASLFAMTLSGEWCDRTGPSAPLFAGIAAFGAGLVVAGSAQNMWIFVAGRGIQGLGGGLVIVALYVVASRAYPDHLRPSVMAAFSAAWVLPVIVGPLVAGTVTEHLGWRWVFLSIPVLILPPLAVMLPALRKLSRREAAGTEGAGTEGAGTGATDTEATSTEATGSEARTDRGVGGMDRRRIVLALAAATGTGLLQYAGQDLRWLSLIPAVAGLALLGPAIVRLLPRGTFRAARGLPSVILTRALAAGSLFAAESFVPLMLVTERGLSPTLAGLSLTGGGLTWALGSYTQSRPRLEPYRERLMVLGMLFVAAAVLAVPLALIEGVTPWIVAVAWVLAGYGIGLTISSGGVLLMKLSRPQEAGINSASLQVSDALGNIVFVGIGGVLFVAFGGGSVAAGGHAPAVDTGGQPSHLVHPTHPAAFTAVFVAMTVVALAGAYFCTRLKPEEPQKPERERRSGVRNGVAGYGAALRAVRRVRRPGRPPPRKAVPRRGP